jgi:TolA-binding protein
MGEAPRLRKTPGQFDMTTSATPPPDDPAWAHIRARYEQNQETVLAIATEIGMPQMTLSLIAKKCGWRMRGKTKRSAAPKAKADVVSKAETTTATIRRLKDILQQRVTQLETQLKQIGEEVSALSTEREIRSTNTLVRTIEKVLDLERKDRQKKRKETRDFKYFDDAQRQQLADKITRLQHAWRGEETVDGAADPRSGGVEQPVALLGEAGKTTAAPRD